MQILLRITKMAWRYRARLVLAYVSFFASIGFALLVPRLFGTSMDRLVRFDPVDGRVIPLQVDTSTLVLMALALLGASVMRLSLIHISEPTRLLSISYAVFC